MNLSLLVVFPYLRLSFFSHCFSTSPLTLVRNFIRLILFYFTLKISLNTMKSKICSNLFFAGEVTYVFFIRIFRCEHICRTWFRHWVQPHVSMSCQCQALSRFGKKNIILFYCDLIDVYVADTECWWSNWWFQFPGKIHVTKMMQFYLTYGC
jgi:hypothetical protein